MHQDIVTEIPEGFLNFGSSSICSSHIMLNRDKKCLTIQGHPEFTKDYVTDVVEIRTEKGIFSLEFQQEILKKHAMEVHSSVVIKEFLNLVCN